MCEPESSPLAEGDSRGKQVIVAVLQVSRACFSRKKNKECVREKGEKVNKAFISDEEVWF